MVVTLQKYGKAGNIMVETNEFNDEAINQAAWTYIGLHYDKLYRMCLKACRGDPNQHQAAEELMSDEVYRQMYGLLERWDRSRSFESYAASYFYRHLRKIQARKWKKKMESFDLMQNSDAVNLKMIDLSHSSGAIAGSEQEAKLMVLDLLEHLTQVERTVIVMCKMYNFTYRETAAKLGVSVGQVSKLVNQALVKMREAGE